MVDLHRCACSFESLSGKRWIRKHSLQTAVNRFRKMTGMRLMRMLQRGRMR